MCSSCHRRLSRDALTAGAHPRILPVLSGRARGVCAAALAVVTAGHLPVQAHDLERTQVTLTFAADGSPKGTEPLDP